MSAVAFSPEHLAAAARRLPSPLLQDAAGGSADHLEDDFHYATAGLFKFGERLIYSAGLAVSALYLGLSKADDSYLDHRLLGHIRTILFSRPYDSGLAQSILERFAFAGERIGVYIQQPPQCVSGFLGLQKDTPANTFRARHLQSLEEAFAYLLDYLSFLTRLNFTGKDNAEFNGVSISVWPFFRWDGTTLFGLRETRLSPEHRNRHLPDLPRRILYVSHEDTDEIDTLYDVTPLERQTLIRVAAQVGHAHKDEPEGSGEIESFIPVITRTYNQMDELLDLIMAKASNKRKYNWLEWYLAKGAREKPKPTEVRRAMRDKTRVENAIVAYALEYDPIVLLTEYLQYETDDIEDWIKKLEPRDHEMTLARIDDSVRTFEQRVEPIYVHGEQKLRHLAKEHRARMAAVEIAHLLKFNIRHVTVRQSIEDYADRLADFYGHVVDHPDDERIDRGLKQSCIICEEVLEFIHLFYKAVDGFEMASDTGLGITARSILQKEASTVRNRGLGHLIGCFDRLCTRYEHGLPHLGQRRQLRKDAAPHLKTLTRLNEWRNRSGEIHRNPTLSLTTGQRLDLLRDVVGFLQWLRKPNTNRPGTFERICPAVLQLNVLTTNRCGVTSVKYVLRESNDNEAVRLYTQQRVAGIAGVFYGLPIPGKGNAELWMEPVLFAADAFEDAIDRRPRP
jgi:hypothetical protein